MRAAPGQEIHAPADGVIAFRGMVAGRPVLSVQHPDGLRSTYEPVIGALPVGRAVRAGEVIGHLADGPGHCPPGSCLHWGVRLSDRTYLDPLALLGEVEIVLLPMR